ncbi:MAG: putative acetyl-coenzyme synthetase [Frankiales bacterium]|nr:putative acetyl-coenzyme synthetase [Frankiales bacterium]
MKETALTESPATTAYRTARDSILGVAGRHEEAVAAFSWPDVGDRFNWAIDWYDVIAEGNSRPALVIVEQDGTRTERTYAELAARSNQVARFLAGLGVGKGDSVLLMLGNQVQLWELMLATMKLGAVVVPTTTALGTADLVDRVERAEARCVVAGPADTGKFDEVPGDYVRVVVGGEADGWTPYSGVGVEDDGPVPHPETGPGDRLLLYFTSGTTSRPKLVEHTQVSYPVGHLTTTYWIGLEPGDVHLNISSPGWAKHAWSCFFAPWIAEATIYLYNYTRFDAPALLERIRTDGVTTFCAPPTVWRMLINADLSGGPGALRQVVAAGEPLNPEVISQVERAWGLTIRDGFGQTETTLTVANTPDAVVKPGSMGRPLPGCPVVLVDPVSGELAEEGEICLDLSKAPLNLMTGYLGDPERDAEAKSGGYYHSGDVASRDSDGYLTYVGRTDDVFKASDYKISPFELESVLIEHPAVLEAAVVPAPDPVRLAVPKAYIALAAGWEPTRETAFAILKHARENLAPFLRVRRVEFFELPKTVSGKIRRVELRQREEELAETPSTSEWRDEQFPELSGSA